MVENLNQSEVWNCVGKFVDKSPEKSGSLYAEWEGRIIEIFGHNIKEKNEDELVESGIRKEYPLNLKCQQESQGDGSIRTRILEVISPI